MHSHLSQLIKNHAYDAPKRGRKRVQSINKTDWVKGIFKSAQQGARTRGLPFDLTLEDVQAMAEAQDGVCAVTGMRFSLRKPKRGIKKPWAPSIDRIDSSLGYSPENCRIVTIFANIAMSDWGDWVISELKQELFRTFLAHNGQEKQKP